MSEGLAAVQSRILEIQYQLGIARPPTTSNPAPSSASPGTSATQTDFASMLQQATAALSTSTDLSSHANGRLPDSALVPIGGGERLAPPAAKAFLRMQADAAAAGVTIGVNDSYRSFDEQVEVAKDKGLYGHGGLAAVPGTSNHGKGISVDLELNAPAQQWMKTNADRYGFANDVRGEPWHWTFKS